MKRLMMIYGALAMAACAPQAATTAPVTASTPQAPVEGVIAKADTVILTGERAFAVAELTYTTAANGVARLVDAGLIRGAAATRVRGWNSQARDLLVRGKAVADTAERARIATRLFGISDSLNSLLGGR